MQGCACVSVGVCMCVYSFYYLLSPLAILPFHCPRCFCILLRICCTFYNSNRNCHPFAQFVVLAARVHPPSPPLRYSSHFLSSLTRTYLGIFKLGYTHTHTYIHTSYATIRCFCHFQFEIAAAAAPLTRPLPLFFHLVETTSN